EMRIAVSTGGPTLKDVRNHTAVALIYRVGACGLSDGGLRPHTPVPTHGRRPQAWRPTTTGALGLWGAPPCANNHGVWALGKSGSIAGRAWRVRVLPRRFVCCFGVRGLRIEGRYGEFSTFPAAVRRRDLLSPRRGEDLSLRHGRCG